MTKFDIFPAPDTRTPEQQLEDGFNSLRSHIGKSPKLSATAERAQRLIDNLTAPDCSFSTSQKLTAVRETLRNYADARRVDNVLDHPGDRPPKRVRMA
jgi:hypothetical protein